MINKLRAFTVSVLSIAILSQGLPVAVAAKDAEDNQLGGRWMKGEYHAHTTQSDDTEGSQSLESLLNDAFDQYGMDWMGTSDHLRMSSRDDEGHLIPGGPYRYPKGSFNIKPRKWNNCKKRANIKIKSCFQASNGTCPLTSMSASEFWETSRDHL